MAAQLELEQRPFIELQIEELIEENRVKPGKVSKFINELESRIVAIKNKSYEKLLPKTIELPILGRPNATAEDDYPKSFKFIPPEKLNIIGGFRTATALKRTRYIDLAVQMPAACIKDKDIKNQRYHMKRALYLAQLGRLMSNDKFKLKLIERLEFSYYQGDFLKPVLIITPQKCRIKQNVAFQLFVYPHQDAPLKPSMLVPGHGNVAPKWFFEKYPFEKTEDGELQGFVNGDSDVTETPFYNSSILFDIDLLLNSEVVYEQIGNQKSIIQALMLTKVWLYQRGLHHHFSFIISMFVAYLQTRQSIHQNMSSYQIFKKIVHSLTSIDWAEAGLSFYDDSSEKITEFKSLFPVVFLSPSGQLNLCYNITIDMYNRLKHEAKLAETILSQNHSQTFELLFLKKIEFVDKFDILVQIPKCTRKLPAEMEYIKKFLDHGVSSPRVYSEGILKLIHKGLTDRVILVQQDSDHSLMTKSWKLNNPPYNPSYDDDTFTLGLLLEPEKCLRIIDIGPEAQSPDAEQYREFWGPKCQLRLQNGVISETVVWYVEKFSQRRDIVKYILNHSLKKAEINNFVVHHTSLERFIRLDNVFFCWSDETTSAGSEENGGKRKREEGRTRKPIGVGEEVFQRALNAYNELNKLIRTAELKYLITSVQPVSSHLRASSVFPPLPVGLQQKQKSLKKQKGVTLFPEAFSDINKILPIEPIDVLITLGGNKWPNDGEALKAAKTDFILRLSDWLREREYATIAAPNHLDVLCKQFVYRFRVKCPKDRNNEAEVAPLVHSNLDQIYREKPAFGITCRLVKRWLSCQLMTDLIDDVQIEQMVAELFLNPEPYTEPASSLCGFRRFLTSYASKAELKEDNLKMLSKLCAEALDGEKEYKNLFKPDFKRFDMLIKLNSGVIQNFFMTVDPPKNFKLLGREVSFKVMPIIGLNLVERLVGILQIKFGQIAKFHYDKYGQRIIGVNLRPESEKLLEGDLESFINDLKSVGTKMIDKITLVKKTG